MPGEPPNGDACPHIALGQANGKSLETEDEDQARRLSAFGKAATTAMTHIAIQEGGNGKVVDWMEKVTDEQYQVRAIPPSDPPHRV